MLFYKIDAEMTDMKEIKSMEEKEAYNLGLYPMYDDFYQKNNREIFVFVSSMRNKKLSLGALTTCKLKISSKIESFLSMIEINCQNIEISEITLGSMTALLRTGDRYNYVKDEDEVTDLFNLNDLTDYRGRMNGFSERIIPDIASKAEMIHQSDYLLCGETLTPEIERIYKGATRTVKSGHPVHYLIQTDDSAVRDQILNILLAALYANGRIYSKRFCSVNFKNKEETLSGKRYQGLYKAAFGGIMVVNYSGSGDEENEYADVGTGVIAEICSVFNKYKNNVLTVLCLPRSAEKEKSAFMERLGIITLVPLNEETVFGEKAKMYLKRAARIQGISPNVSLYKNIKDADKGYITADLNKVFDRWFSNSLKNKIYSQYADFEFSNNLIAKKPVKGSAYQNLDKMIGLTEAKTVIKQAVDYYKAQRMFKEKGMSADHAVMHMIFTGNPGTAKTTVARLFAQIMKDNGLLSVGNLYEVGRADLVGKFVGWTAPTVKEKFRAAKGSVLFIDEAYSLVDDRNGMFGDEAINTIVQEMENNREDMVVIFAGYPEKMEQFMQKNPGLRSRIAFHLPFHDYTASDLYQIMALMLEKKELRLDDEAKTKLLPMFTAALDIDDFGNGRFVRNLLENARIKQASRLIAMDIDKVTKDDVATLVAADFDMPVMVSKQEQKKVFGFQA